MGNGRVYQWLGSELWLVELFIFPGKQNLFERSNWVNLHGTHLRNNFCQEINKITFKNSYCTDSIEFETILHNTEYILRCLKTVQNFDFQSLKILVVFACCP